MGGFIGGVSTVSLFGGIGVSDPITNTDTPQSLGSIQLPLTDYAAGTSLRIDSNFIVAVNSGLAPGFTLIQRFTIGLSAIDLFTEVFPALADDNYQITVTNFLNVALPDDPVLNGPTMLFFSSDSTPVAEVRQIRSGSASISVSGANPVIIDFIGQFDDPAVNEMTRTYSVVEIISAVSPQA